MKLSSGLRGIFASDNHRRKIWGGVQEKMPELALTHRWMRAKRAKVHFSSRKGRTNFMKIRKLEPGRIVLGTYS